MNKKQVEYLQYKFSDAEIRVLSQDAGRIDQEMKTLENRLDQIKKSLAGELAEKKTELSKLMAKMAGGFEYRNVDCEIQLDTPKQGQASIVRLDTDEVVKVRRMTDEELQIQLPLEGEVAEEPIPEPEPVAEVVVEPEPEPEPEPEVVAVAEPEPIVPAELRRFEYTNVGCAACIVVFSDEYQKIRVTATASIEGLDPFDAGSLGYADTVGAAAREGALAIYRWAKDINANSKPGLAKAVSMAIITWISNLLNDVKNGAV